MATLFHEYDAFAEFYDDFADSYSDDIPILIAEAEAAGAGAILELCSGTGRCCFALADGGYDVVGVDNSSAMIEIAQTKLRRARRTENAYSNVSFYHSDVENLDLIRKDFDMAFATWSSLQHLTMDGRKRCYQAVYEHLQPGGIFVDDEAIRATEELESLPATPRWYPPRPIFYHQGAVFFQYYVDQFDSDRGVMRRQICQDRCALEHLAVTLPDESTGFALALTAPKDTLIRKTIEMEFFQPDVDENEGLLFAAGFEKVEYRSRPSKGGTSRERLVIVATKARA